MTRSKTAVFARAWKCRRWQKQWPNAIQSTGFALENFALRVQRPRRNCIQPNGRQAARTSCVAVTWLNQQGATGITGTPLHPRADVATKKNFRNAASKSSLCDDGHTHTHNARNSNNHNNNNKDHGIKRQVGSCALYPATMRSNGTPTPLALCVYNAIIEVAATLNGYAQQRARNNKNLNNGLSN